ncbi:unnamed protein product, partial [Prorocentrum cordatum]
ARARALQVENKLEGAALELETMEQQVDAQRRHVTCLREELQQSEKGHSDLVRQLHAQLAAQSEPDVPPSKLSVDDVLDLSKLERLLDLSAAGILNIDETDCELKPDDQKELEARAAHLRECISDLRRSALDMMGFLNLLLEQGGLRAPQLLLLGPAQELMVRRPRRPHLGPMPAFESALPGSHQ